MEFRAIFKKLDGPRVDGGYVVQFDIGETDWEAIKNLPRLRDKNLVISIQEEGKAFYKKPTSNQYTQSQFLLEELKWTPEKKEAYLLATFGKRSRTELTQEEMDRFIKFLISKKNSS